MLIESKNKPRYKSFLNLFQNRERKKTQQFLIEGLREISRALQTQTSIELFIFSQSVWEKGLSETFQSYSNYCILPDALFKNLSVRENPDGYLAIARTWQSDFSRIHLKNNGLYLLVEHLEKPGNLGALMRSAEATAVDGFIIADPQVDIFNPHVIRASQGAVFNLPIVWNSNENILNWLKQSHLTLFATTPSTDTLYWDCDMRQGCILCVGNEAKGLSNFWFQHAQKIAIPIYGSSADSLNANISGTLCLYEAKRQRSQK